MRLPEDVAIEVANKIQDMVRLNRIVRVQPLHIEMAHKIVNTNLFADSIMWLRIITGDNNVHG